ncbi:MAG: hypothetical protein QM737_18265 [Ferruginibacter sp.]
MSIIDKIQSLFGNGNNKNDPYAQRLLKTKEFYPFQAWRESFDEGLDQYTEKNCNRARKIFDTLISDLIKLGENASEAQKIEAFKKAILATNVLDEETEGTLIETGEREELCELTNEITKACDLDPLKYGGGEGLATEWREW